MRGGADPLFTWQQGLDRIILGWMLPDNGELWQNHARETQRWTEIP